MRLHPDDIKAIASEVVRQMRQIEGVHLDQAHIARLPVTEQKAMARAQRAAEVAAEKLKTKGA